MSWTLTMNSDGGSKGLFVFLSTAWAVRVYWALSSRSSVLVAWMFPDLSSITKIIPAPSPERMYLMFPSPESISEWSYKKRNRHTLTRGHTFLGCAYETKKCRKLLSFHSFQQRWLPPGNNPHSGTCCDHMYPASRAVPAQTCLLPHAGCWKPNISDLKKRIHKKILIAGSAFAWSW